MAKVNLISIPESEYETSATRSSGPGGQHVNKVSTAIRLQYDIEKSSLSIEQKSRLRKFPDKRIGKGGIITIKVENNRTQLRNKAEAIERLRELVTKALKKPKKRIPTKMSKAVKKRILEKKRRRSQTKSLRKKVDY